MKTAIWICVSGYMAVSALTAATDSDKRPIKPEDYYGFEIPGDPQVSPDGKIVAYTIGVVDRKANRRRSEIWFSAMDGGREPWQVTTGESSSSPRWSPDGKSLGFISARHDPQSGAQQKAQVYILSLGGGEARRVTDLKNGVSWFRWSPDSSKFVCLSKIGPSDSFAPGKERSDVRDFTNPAYKFDGTGFFDDRHAHIWIVDAVKGTARQLTSGETRDDSEPQWSPDGAKIAFIGMRSDKSLMSNSGLYTVAAAGGEPVQISAPGSFLSSLQWSHDGRRLGYIGAVDDVNIPKIFISALDGGAFHVANDKVTYPANLEWSEDDSTLYFSEAFRGEHPLFSLNLKSGQLKQLTSNITVRQASISKAANKIVFTAGDDVHPGEVFATPLEGEKLQLLTKLNRKLLAELDLQKMERMPFRAADGLPVEGFFLKPVDWTSGQKYPMVLMIHGGPNGMWGPQWNIDAHVFAAQGWAVLLINPRGSSGYGEAFQRGVDKEWGGKAYGDLMTGVNTALAKYPWVDANHLGVTGQSFGGFMTDWIVGQTTRFKAATTLSGIADLISVEGTRDAFYGHDRDFGGDLWENFDLYWKYSPIRNAKNVKTPTLILHGDADQRVPISQGEEFFRALYHFGVPTEMVMFPREPHSIRAEPKHAVELMKWQIYWFQRYLDGNEKAVKPNAESNAS